MYIVSNCVTFRKCAVRFSCGILQFSNPNTRDSETIECLLLQVFYGAGARTASPMPVQVKDIPSNATFTTTLTELRKFVVYSVQVLAYTRLGDGALSSPPERVQTFEDGNITFSLMASKYFVIYKCRITISILFLLLWFELINKCCPFFKHIYWEVCV